MPPGYCPNKRLFPSHLSQCCVYVRACVRVCVSLSALFLSSAWLLTCSAAPLPSPSEIFACLVTIAQASLVKIIMPQPMFGWLTRRSNKNRKRRNRRKKKSKKIKNKKTLCCTVTNGGGRLAPELLIHRATRPSFIATRPLRLGQALKISPPPKKSKKPKPPAFCAAARKVCVPRQTSRSYNNTQAEIKSYNGMLQRCRVRGYSWWPGRCLGSVQISANSILESNLEVGSHNAYPPRPPAPPQAQPGRAAVPQVY